MFLAASTDPSLEFPRPVTAYAEPAGSSLGEMLAFRAQADPFNVVATVIFALAIVHTFLTPKFRHWAHEAEARHRRSKQTSPTDLNEDAQPDEVSFKGQMLHFLGEVEAVFGIWAVILLAAITVNRGWETAEHYLASRQFTEPMFVVVIMALAATAPLLRVAEGAMRLVTLFGGGTVSAWWLTILIVAPLLGSFITEPAAMTIAALLLSRKFYVHRPSPALAYGTIGLLFVNVSVGGTMTHFAAPPVLMVARVWQWDTPFMLAHFGWRAALGIVVATVLYFCYFRKELKALETKKTSDSAREVAKRAVPRWVTAINLAFLGWVVFTAHTPALFIGGFLFYLAFAQATAHHQGKLELRSPLLVGFFLAGLVVHGGLQAWWIDPILKSLGEISLFVGATLLTAFNDNAAITYLASLVPGFTDSLKYAVVAGAVTGGGLTVIANAPNPAGQSILQRFFPDGVSPLWLAVSALLPTVIMALCFMAI